MGKFIRTIIGTVCGITAALAAVHSTPAWGAVMNDYCVQPPFITQTIPPLVLLSMSKDHKMYYPAYNDASDLDGDGQLDVGYKHSIDYYGYFDPYKCYTYSTTNKVFTPTSLATNKYCSGTSTEWAGNFLNWLSMSRIDVVRRVLYGGSRTTDTNTGTIISGEQIPRDGHSWGKEYPRYEDMSRSPAPSDQRKLFPNAIANRRSLFCVTTNGNATTPRSLLRVIADPSMISTADVSNSNATFPLRPWHWASVDGPSSICATNMIDKNNDGVAESVTFTTVDYEISVKACDNTLGNSYLEPVPGKCQLYGSNYKPVGILQKFGTSDGTKVCSKTLSKTCTTDADCNATNNGGTAIGVCVDRSSMYFGLLTGTYKNPKAGGVLRKQISSVLDEIDNSTGVFDVTLNAKGNIIGTLENMTCPTTYPLPTHWGNPMGEIIYESLRYLAGLGSATTAFSTGINNGATTGGATLGSDNGFNLPAPTWDTPLANFPSCSKPFVLLFSDVYNSYDSDQIPGADFGTIAATTTNDLPHLDINALTNAVGINESMATAMIGEVKSVNSDTFCTEKSFSSSAKLGSARGLCPAEPDEQGSFSSAGMAFYGHTKFATELTGKPNVTFYSLPFPSYVPELKIKAGTSTITMIPTGQSIANSTPATGVTWDCTAQYNYSLSPTTQPDTSVNTPSKGLVLTPKGSTTGACPRLQMVSYYILGDPLYDSTTGLMKYVRFRISSDDIGGGDYDMDTLAEYEVCEGESCPQKSCGSGNYKYCTSTECSSGHCPDVPNGKVRVTLESKYSSAGNDAALGFVVAGTTADGLYLPVRKWNASGCTSGGGGCSSGVIWSLPETRAMIFTPDGTGGQLPKNPLWFAAKYGAFKDIDNDGRPFTDSTCGTSSPNSKCSEWDSQHTGDPDTYYLISNPLQMEQQLSKALTDILKRVSSGTAASILSNSEGTGANLIQAIFYPSKIFGNNTTTTVAWTGELLNLWYYIDPFIGNSTIREETGYTSGNHYLDLASDRIIRFFFDTNANLNQTRVEFIKDTNGDGVGERSEGYGYPEDVQALWRAGSLLWSTSPADRTVKTSCLPTATCANGFMGFNANNNTLIQPYLVAASSSEATDIINYLLGTDKTGYRSRNAIIGAQSNIWKLGDIVSSTPKIEPGLPLNNYHLPPPSGYSDTTYATFIGTNSYKTRGMVFAGANDGMLHAFKLGTMDVRQTGTIKGTLTGTNLGTEQWAFIPKQALPYLKYLTDPTYNHLYYVDATPVLADISTAKDGACTSTNYWDCVRTASSWKTILIGGMGLGGATRISTDTTCTDCVKTPRTDPADGTKGLGYSTYFAMDVTDPTAPVLKWEFSDPDLGYTINGPAIVRVGDKTKNGRWFAVFVSGPTGPIDTTNHQFMGRSDKSLKIFVLDAETGTLLTTISTLKDNSGIPYAFGGSLSGGAIDSDRWNAASSGLYQDDALYFGYVARAGSSSPYTWTSGGVMRLMTYENIDPTAWKLSKVISGVGPVTTAIARLQDRTNKALWLYFGTGRYFYRSAANGVDDNDGQRAMYGVKEPCYAATTNDLKNSSDTCEDTSLTSSNLTNQSSGSTDVLTSTTDKGWYINLDAATSTVGAERIVTNTVALSNGQVFFTSFKPTADICGFGGTSYLWGLKYNTGYQIPPASLYGKALIQMSTGSFEQVNLSSQSSGQNVSIFTDKENRRITTAMQGKPPGDAPLLITRSANKPVKKILHIQEK